MREVELHANEETSLTGGLISEEAFWKTKAVVGANTVTNCICCEAESLCICDNLSLVPKEFVVFNRALSSSQQQYVYAALSPTEPALLELYRLDQENMF